MDHHLHQQALFAKFRSLVTQLVVDMIAGFIMLALLWYYPSFFVDLVNTVGSRLHLDQVLKSTYWLFGNPAGFKPNINLSHFLGNFVLELIFVWNHVTSALTKVKLLIVFYISSVGVLGFSV